MAIRPQGHAITEFSFFSTYNICMGPCRRPEVLIVVEFVVCFVLYIALILLGISI